jgi:hypothetical protein
MGMISRGWKSLALVTVLLVAMALASAQAAQRTEGPDPAVKEWPTWPYPTSCDGYGLPFDPVSVFSGPTGAELGSSPSEVALRKFLDGESWIHQFVPAHDWRLLAETEDRAEFASGRLSQPDRLARLSFERDGGEWKWSGSSSGCQPTSIINGRSAITWQISPEQNKVDRKTRRLLIDLGPGPCASGMSQNARAMKPIFQRLGGRRWLMIMQLKPLPPGVYTCQGILDPPLRVTLPSRIGKRRLLDGGTYPPIDVVRQWREARAASLRRAAG